MISLVYLMATTGIKKPKFLMEDVLAPKSQQGNLLLCHNCIHSFFLLSSSFVFFLSQHLRNMIRHVRAGGGGGGEGLLSPNFFVDL